MGLNFPVHHLSGRCSPDAPLLRAEVAAMLSVPLHPRSALASALRLSGTCTGRTSGPPPLESRNGSTLPPDSSSRVAIPPGLQCHCPFVQAGTLNNHSSAAHLRVLVANPAPSLRGVLPPKRPASPCIAPLRLPRELVLRGSRPVHGPALPQSAPSRLQEGARHIPAGPRLSLACDRVPSAQAATADDCATLGGVGSA